MADPKSISFGPGNLGLATPITGLARPAMSVYAQQQQEEKLRKQKEAADKERAVEDNQEFGEELFKDKFSSLDTQRNEYKNRLLKGLKETYNQANLEYSAKGQTIPLEKRQILDRQLQSFKDEWEQIETAYGYTQDILNQTKKDTNGLYNVNAFREVLMDIPTTEEGNFDLSKYNERYIHEKIKSEADVLYNLPKVAEEYAKSLAETTLAQVKDLGDGRHEEITDKFSGLIKLHTGVNGKPTPYAPDGSIQLDISNESIGRARQHHILGPAMEAMIKKGKAEDYIDAYQQIASGQLGVEQKIDRQGTTKSVNGSGNGYSVPETKVTTRFDTINRALTEYDTDALAQMFDAGGMVDVEFKGNEYGPGESIPDRIVIQKKEKYNHKIHRWNDRSKSGYVTVKEEIDISNDKKKREAFFKINKFINASKDRASTEVVPNDDIQRFMNKMDARDQENDVLGLFKKPKSGIFEDPLKLYDMEEEVVNPEGESLY